jgi:glycosyltransferase involved in cell wall biosynthesis
MRVSVVIAVRNDAERLRVLLQSIAGLPESPQVIVVDNGSTDDSAKVASGMGAEVLVCPGLRVGALRNRGVEIARGEVIAFADSDHEVPTDWIAMGCEGLSKGSDVLAAGSHYLAPVDGTWVQQVWAIHRLRGEDCEAVDWLGAGNLFVRRVDFDRVGGFREDLIAAEDVDLCHRLRQLGGTVLCDKQIRSIHHGEPKTLVAFFRKEYWRGSSGIRAWVSQGYPLRDLPSLVWPVWHLLLGVGVLFALVWMWMPWSVGVVGWLGVLLLCWVAPACLLGIRTGVRERRWAAIPGLAVLYFTYGLARAAALFK